MRLLRNVKGKGGVKNALKKLSEYMPNDGEAKPLEEGEGAKAER